MVNTKAFQFLQKNLKAFLAAEVVSECDEFKIDQDDAAEELEEPRIPGVLTRRATTQAQLDDEEFFRDLNGISESRTSTGLSEKYPEWSILYYTLLLWEIMKRYYILILQYLLLLAPPSDLERLSKKVTQYSPAHSST